MAILQNLSLLAVRQLFEGACRTVGLEAGAVGAEAVVGFLTSRFLDHSQRLTRALEVANGHAWHALEISLAGDTWWERIKVTLSRREDQAFREQVRAFLDATPLGELPDQGAEFRRLCLQELRAARKQGVLTQGTLQPHVLAKELGQFARHGDPGALLQAEWQALDGIAAALQEFRFPNVARLVALRPREGPALLAVAVRYFFRRQVETDAELFQGLAFAQMERLSQGQEAGYAALHEALTAHAGRLAGLLDEVHAVVVQTHGDVKEIKEAMARHGQQLQAVGQAVFQALARPMPVPEAPADRKQEENLRLRMLNTLLTTPHRRLEEVWPVHQELVSQDPRFYVRLAAWYADKGEVRDHKEMFIITLALSTFPGHRDVGLALLRGLPPYQVARVVDFIHGRKETRRQVPARAGSVSGGKNRHKKNKRKAAVPVVRPKAVREVVGDFGLFRNVPRSLKTEVERYLREREADPAWFDSTVLAARRALKRLYAVLHIAPGERAQKILFEDKPPEDSRLHALKRIAAAGTAEEKARAIVEARLPFRVAVSVAGEMTREVVEALIERMSPQELINNLGMLGRHGALADPDLKTMIDLKLEEAKGHARVSTFKAEAALGAVDVGEALQRKLEEVADVNIKARGRIRRPTALLVDKSGSMELCIDVGKRVAAMLSAVCEGELYVYAFDTMAYPVVAEGAKDWAAWKRAFAGIRAHGETSVGVALEVMRRRRQAVEQIIVVTDEEEYSPPYFVESLLKYRQELGVDPGVCFVKVPDSSARLEEQCKRAGIVANTFTFTGDYYALPNLVALVEPPSELDLLMEIMECPLPERRC